MCKEDIRIGIKKTYRLSTTSPAQGQVVKVLSARGDRLGVTFAAGGGNFTAALETMEIGPQVAGVVIPIAVLSPDRPSVYLGVEEYGELVTGELWAWNNTLGGSTPTIYEVFFTQPLEDV